MSTSAAAPTATVRAARLHRLGESLIIDQLPLPEPAEGEVRVRFQFGGVNPIDRYIAAGRVNPDGRLPRTLGGEAAGVADGKLVLVAGEGLGAVRDGVWAQAANVPREAVVPIPDGVHARDAAAMGIAGLTAFNCVRELGRVSDEDRVLVLGASGGVGGMIVSLAGTAGAIVWGQTGSEAKAGPIAEAGASRVLVGGPEDLAAKLSEFAPTIVFDPLGDGFVAPSIEALSERGRYVSYGVSAGAEVTFNLQLVYRKMLSILGYGGGQLSREQRCSGLEAALAALEQGAIKVRVDAVLPLDGVNDAFSRIEHRQVQGKLLLDLS